MFLKQDHLREDAVAPALDLSAAILAGGASRRFGRDKAHAELMGRALINHVAESLRSVFEEILIVSNCPERLEGLDLEVVSDIWRGKGSLGGVFTALVHARHPRCFLVACDMPFLNPSVVRLLADQRPGYDVVVPSVRGELQPLHAIYSKKCLPFIRRGIQAGDYRIVEFYPRVSVLQVAETEWKDFDPDNRSFFNINTLEDLEEARIRSQPIREGARAARGPGRERT